MSCCAKKTSRSCKSDVPLSSSHHETGKSVLEDLLETKAVLQQSKERRVSSELTRKRSGLRKATHNLRMERLTVGWSRSPPL